VVVLHFIFAQQHSICWADSFLQQDATFLDILQAFMSHEIAACVPKLSIKENVNINLNNFIIFLFITYTNHKGLIKFQNAWSNLSIIQKLFIHDNIYY
tara:strand:- start:5399 stop:5692 length:294 start_codon:yes stop_codon:yes gene_type:complete